MCSGVPEPFGQAKIYGVDQVTLLAETHEKVVRFDVPMQKIFAVDIFYSADL